MTVSPDKDRFLQAIYEPVRGFDLRQGSRWERSSIYWACHELLIKLLFERHIHTSGRAIELEHFDPEFVHYVPSAWLAMRWAFRQLQPGPADVFVEFGCGKGRVICEAARHRFARVVGVDISRSLVLSARANVERNRPRFRCQHIELVTADAAQWDIPDDMTIGYMNYPFVGQTFQRVIDNIVASIARNPRRVRLVYLLPLLEQYIEGTGYFRLLKRRRGRGRLGRVVNSVALFEHDPAQYRGGARGGFSAA